MTLRTNVEIDAVTSAVTSPWFFPDYKYDDNPVRAFAGSISSGAQFSVQVAVSVNKVMAGNSPNRIVTAYTNTTTGVFTGTVYGSWPLIRVAFTSAAPGTDFVLLSY